MTQRAFAAAKLRLRGDVMEVVGTAIVNAFGQRQRRTTTLALAGMLLIPGGPATAQRTTTRDSAGITIVHTSRAATPRRAFVLSEAPAVRIDGRNDVLEYLFSPNVVAVARLSDGRFVVGDQWSFNVRIYGADGTYQRTFGSMGGEPGQLGVMTRIFIMPADTIAVVDGRIHLFTPEGKFIRVESMGVQGMTAVSRLNDGDWITRRGTGRDSVRVFRVSRTATGASPSDTGLRLAVYDPRDPSLGTAGAYVPNMLGSTPFLPQTVIAGSSNGFLIGDGKTMEILDYSSNGRLRRIIRADVDLRLTDAIKEQYQQSERANKQGEALAAVETRLANAVWPKTIPAFQRMLVDPSGRIWVQGYLRANHIPLEWTVFDPSGKMLGTVEVPVGFRAFEVGKDYILGRFRDPKGQAHIQLYRLLPAKK
jgi:hypothetical protein